MDVTLKHFFFINFAICAGIEARVRTNIDYTFIFREPNVQKQARSAFAGMFPTFDVFQQVMDSARTTTGW
jgi:hypothetical protein